MKTYFTKNRACFSLMGRSFASVGLFLLLSTLCAQAALFNLTSVLDKKGVRIPGPTVFTTVSGPTQTIAWSQYVGTDSVLHDGAVINGALILPSLDPSGSGSYRRLYALDTGGTTTSYLNGYNRELPNKTVTEFDSKVPNCFDPKITIAQLVDNSGYYQFSLDINEKASGTHVFLSIDDLQVYVGPATEPGTLPSTVAGLSGPSGLGTLIWDLQGGLASGAPKNHILTSGSGSGADEMTFLIPKSLFPNVDTSSQVYLYSKVGALGFANDTGVKFTGFEENGGGFEEWGTLVPRATPPTFVRPATEEYPTVPEPPTALPALCLMLAGLSRRSRTRVACNL